MEYDLVIKKEWKFAVCSNRMEQEIITLGEASQKEKDK